MPSLSAITAMPVGNVCLVHLQTLEGAVSDTEYNQLPEEVKKRLKDFSDNLK